MNERIKELAEQAGIEFTYDPTETPMRAFVECWEDELDKFAELIVRECEKVVADEIETNNKPNIDWGWDDHEQGYVTGMRAATKFIKEHFGVEE